MTGLLCLEGAGFETAGRWPVRDASLALEPGRLTCLVGPNGSGKSSLLRLLSGLWVPSEGRVTLDGVDMADLSRREVARRVALVPQHTRLSFAFTVREVTAMGRYPHEGRLERSDGTTHPAVVAALERVDASDLSERLVTTLSGGEAQRVLLARCLAAEAGVLLLDEPTSALDLSHGLAVMSLCRSLAEDGRSVAVALHDLNAALRWGDRVIVLSGGRIVADGEPAAVLDAALIGEVFGVRAEPLVDSAGGRVYRFDER